MTVMRTKYITPNEWNATFSLIIPSSWHQNLRVILTFLIMSLRGIRGVESSEGAGGGGGGGGGPRGGGGGGGLLTDVSEDSEVASGVLLLVGLREIPATDWQLSLTVSVHIIIIQRFIQQLFITTSRLIRITGGKVFSNFVSYFLYTLLRSNSALHFCLSSFLNFLLLLFYFYHSGR